MASNAPGLYNDRMASLFGMQTRAVNDNPVRNIKITAETLKNMEQDGLDTSHDMQDLLEEQIKLLKQINKGIKAVGDKIDITNGSSILDNITDLVGMNDNRRGGRNRGGIIRRGFDGFKNITKSTFEWTKRIVGSFGTAFAGVGAAVVGGVKAIPSKALTYVTGMASTIVTSIGSMVADISTLLGDSLKTVAKFAAKIITPALAAWGAWEGLELSRQMDPEGKTGLMGRGNAMVAGGLDDIAFGIPSMISKKLFGTGFAEMAITGDLAKEKLIEQARANGHKSLGDYLFGSFSAPGDARDKLIKEAQSKGQKSLGDYFWGWFSDETTLPETGPVPKARPVSSTAPEVKPNVAEQVLQKDTVTAPPVVPTAENNEFAKFIPFNPLTVVGAALQAKTDIEVSFNNLQKATELTEQAIRDQTLANNVGDKTITAKLDEQLREEKRKNRADEIADGSAPDTTTGTGSVGETVKNAPLPAEQIAPVVPTDSTGVPAKPASPGQVMGPQRTTATSPELPNLPGTAQSAGVTDQSGRVVSTASTDLGVRERALLDTIAIGNPNGKGYWEAPNYNTIVGGKQFEGYGDHPRIFGTADSTAAGRYQFTKSTWDDTVKRYNKQNPNSPITDFSPQNQDRAALFLAEQDYKRRSGGRNLREDMASGMDMGPAIKEYLGGSGKNTTWEVFQKKSAQQVGDAYAANVAKNQQYAVQPQQEKIDGVVQQAQGQVAGIRKQPITPSLQTELAKNVLEVLGEGYRAEVYSGGQPHKGEEGSRTGSTRHDGGMAGDLKIYGPDGKQVTQEQYAAFSQNWLANGRGSIGMQMRGGGIHVDEHKDRAPFWTYDKEGGIRLSENANAAIQKGLKGEKPQLAMTPEQALSKLNPDAVQQMVKPLTLREASQGQPGLARLLQTKDFSSSIKPEKPSPFETKPSTFGDIYGTGKTDAFGGIKPMSDRLLNKQGEAIAKGVVQAERLAPKELSFDPSQQANAIMSGVEQAPANSVVASNPKGNTSNGAITPDINSVPHMDELVMLMANSQMMA